MDSGRLSGGWEGGAGMSEKKWQRVNKEHPCPVCQHTDWCLISDDGSAVICPRVESSKRAGEAGYLHVLNKDTHRAVNLRPRSFLVRMSATPADLSELARKYQAAAEKTSALEKLSASLAVSAENLRRLGVGWV